MYSGSWFGYKHYACHLKLISSNLLNRLVFYTDSTRNEDNV